MNHFNSKPLSVLLVGEYSGVHTCLAAAADDRVRITRLSDGDGFKNFPRDIDIRGRGRGRIIYTVSRIWRELLACRILAKYDVVQFINPLVFSRFSSLRLTALRSLSRGRKSVLLAAGDDARYWAAYRKGSYRYSPHGDRLGIDQQGMLSDIWEGRRLRSIHSKVESTVDAIVPLAIEYDIAYRDVAKKRPIIHFPIAVDALCYKPNVVHQRVLIMHGVQQGREGFKGTRHIDAAMSELSHQHGAEFEYLRPVSVPFSRYQDYLERCNILIDQTNSYSPAMNALFAMARGKIVLSGATEEYLNAVGVQQSQCPIWNIDPEPRQIVVTLKHLLAKRGQFGEMGLASRTFVEQMYDSKRIYGEFFALWRELLSADA
jgi:glycosyltransferase involved in cell wall biosynthesis